jgi:hypothetical protein
MIRITKGWWPFQRFSHALWERIEETKHQTVAFGTLLHFASSKWLSETNNTSSVLLKRFLQMYVRVHHSYGYYLRTLLPLSYVAYKPWQSLTADSLQIRLLLVGEFLSTRETWHHTLAWSQQHCSNTAVYVGPSIVLSAHESDVLVILF